MPNSRRLSPLAAGGLVLSAVVGLIALGTCLALDRQERRGEVAALVEGFAALPEPEQQRRAAALGRIRYSIGILAGRLDRDCSPAACADAAAALFALGGDDAAEHLISYRERTSTRAERALESGDAQRARALLEGLMRMQLEDGRSRRLRANAYLVLGEYRLARKLLEEKLGAGEQLDEQELLDYSYLLCKDRDPERAAEILDAALARYRQSSAIRDNLGFFYLELGQLEKAAALLEEAIALAPEEANPHNNLGLVREAQGSYQVALQLLERAALLQPELPGLAEDVARLRKRVELLTTDPAAADDLPTPRDQYCRGSAT